MLARSVRQRRDAARTPTTGARSAAHGAAIMRAKIARLKQLWNRTNFRDQFPRGTGRVLCSNEDGLTSDPLQPGDHVARVGHAPAKESSCVIFGARATASS